MKRYGTVSFSGKTKAGDFWRQIHSGRKTLTLRERRKDGRPHVKPGHLFTMYWEVRKKRDGKPIHYIGMAECVAYEAVKIVDRWNDEEFAKSDGFQDLEEFRDNWYPEWCEMPWLEDMIKAYYLLNSYPSQLIYEEVVRTMRREFGETAMMAFLELEYMMIKWKYPLVEKGSLHT